MKKRNQTIDIAKGILIVLVVIGHCYSKENIILRAIYSFHMPCFFVLSGMLYAEKWSTYIDFHVGHICRKLLIPYFIFDTLFCLFITVLGRDNGVIAQFTHSFIRVILPLKGITATWYLPCILLVLCTFVLIIKFLKKPLQIYFIVVVFSISLLLEPMDLLIPLWRSFIGLGFFAVGFFGKRIFEYRVNICIWVIVGMVYLLLSEKNGMVSLVALRYANPFLYVVNGLLGSYLLYQCCLRISKRTWTEPIAYIGQNSIVVLCTHMFFIECIRLFDYKLFGNVLYTFGLVEGVAFGGLVLLISIPVIAISNKYFRKFFGK